MKKYVFSIFFFGFLVSAMASAAGYPDPRGHVVDEDINKIRVGAVAGSNSASYWLSRYYLDGISNTKEGEFWLRLSAEQNNCAAIDEYIRFLRSQYKNHLEITDYWVNKYAVLKCSTSVTPG